MALGLGDGAEIRTPMAIAVISGPLSSTALTLLVIPSIYAMADTLKDARTTPTPFEAAIEVGPEPEPAEPGAAQLAPAEA